MKPRFRSREYLFALPIPLRDLVLGSMEFDHGMGNTDVAQALWEMEALIAFERAPLKGPVPCSRGVLNGPRGVREARRALLEWTFAGDGPPSVAVEPEPLGDERPGA